MNPTDIWKLLTENALVSSIVAAAVIAGAAWAWQAFRNSRDSRAICKFLADSGTKGVWTFRTTHAISAETKIAEERVAALCSRHPKIRRNEKELQSWRIES